MLLNTISNVLEGVYTPKTGVMVLIYELPKILGKAIITTNYPSVEDQLTNEINGLIVNADADSIAAGVLRLLNDETIVASLMQNARSSSCFDNPIQSFFRLIDTL